MDDIMCVVNITLMMPVMSQAADEQDEVCRAKITYRLGRV